VLGAQRVQRFADDIGPNERPRGDYQDGRVREAEPLGRDHAPEVDLIADDQVGPPLAAQPKDASCLEAGPPAGVVVSEDAVLSLHVERD
jgi:hypothetical protein